MCLGLAAPTVVGTSELVKPQVTFNDKLAFKVTYFYTTKYKAWATSQIHCRGQTK